MKNSANKKIRNDIILVMAILTLGISIYLVVLSSAKGGSAAYITLDGKEYTVLSLRSDDVIEIKSGAKGEYINTVTVKDGEVFISSANCPDKICSQHKGIKNVGETIVCLPHKLVITIVGEGNGEGVDFIS